MDYLWLFPAGWIGDVGDHELLVVIKHGADTVPDGGGGGMLGILVLLGNESVEFLLLLK